MSRGQPPCHVDGQTLPSELVDHRQHPNRPTVVRPGLHEAVTPEVIAMRGSQTYARAVVDP